jgi:hypothetical protein
MPGTSPAHALPSQTGHNLHDPFISSFALSRISFMASSVKLPFCHQKQMYSSLFGDVEIHSLVFFLKRQGLRS